MEEKTTTGGVLFYTYPLAFNPAKAKLALEEKGLKYTEKRIDIFDGQSLEPWYLKINPHGSVPTLVSGSETLTESLDIIKWADQQGSPLGGDAVDRDFIAEWLTKVDSWDGSLFAAANSSANGLFKATTKHKLKVADALLKRNQEMADVYREKIQSMNALTAGTMEAGVADANRAQLVSLLDEAELRLANSKFLAGEQYSVADVIFTPVLQQVFRAKKDKEYLETRKNVKRYYEEMRKRPSYKKAFGASESGLATMGIILPSLGKIYFQKITGSY